MNHSPIDQNKINLYQISKPGKIDIYMFAPYCNTIHIGLIEYVN